jgi:predicted cupin superfamily sugar epimerase
MSLPYPYPVSNSELIRVYDLESHPEGGYFKQTVALSTELSNGKSVQHFEGPATAWLPITTPLTEGGGRTTDATCIYYLLTPDSSRGKMHKNDNAVSYKAEWLAFTDMQIFHILHAGRALYTLISPLHGTTAEPAVHRIVMGPDPTKGEVTQLFVPGGWWKASELPDDDLLLLDSADPEGLKENIGCLISEIVVPGWNPDQHQFLTEDEVIKISSFQEVDTDDQLRAMWASGDGWKRYIPYLSGPKK